ncbi:MAG: C39 family peptidase [Oscillospiraceae bacterium]|nr:C39 family peptidase [Oscillospiraceae bacterium]
MKIPLQYQRTEYDCGPTALLNAVSFLFAREKIPPDILKYIMMYSLDTYNDKGEACKEGTSAMAMMFLSNWLNQYAKIGKLPIACEFFSGEQVQIGENSHIIAALQQGGAVVLRTWYGCGHYVTLTGISGNAVTLFDPYFRRQPFRNAGITAIKEKPCAANRRIDFSVFNQPGKYPYSLEASEKREALILFNTNSRRTPERTIEYFL